MALMTGTASGITQVMTDHYQIQSAKTAAASQTPLRARLLRDFQKELLHLWNLRDWVIRYAAPADVTVLVNTSSIALPAGWANEGVDGSVVIPAIPNQLTWIPLGQMKAKQALYPNDTGIPREYSVSFVAGVWKLEVFPKAASATVVSCFYETTTPELTDSDSAPSYGGMLYVPDEMRLGALYEGVVLRQLNAKGELQAVGEQRTLYERAVFDLCCTLRQGKPNLDQLPRFPGSAEVYDCDPYGGL